MKKLMTLSLFIFGLFFVVGLQASETSEGLKKDVAEFKQTMNVKLEALDAKIVKLKEKTKTTTSEVETKALTELEDSRDRLRKQITELEVSSKTGWKKMKNRMSYAADKLNKKAQSLLK